MGTKGVCYLVATPIGNLEDMTFRAVRILSEVDLIAAEDTRHTVKLLNHFHISTRMVSYHEHNEKDRSGYLVGELLEGRNVAIVSDAGTPGISDPGHEMVTRCIEEGITVTGIPGACAAIDALVISGLDTKKFTFLGFLSPDKKTRGKEIEEMKGYEDTLILYEAPHKITRTMKALYEYLGEREIVLVRELTKIHETIWRGNISRAIIYLEEKLPRGEYVILIKGEKLAKEEPFWSELNLDQHMAYYIDQGIARKDAVKNIAKDRNAQKRVIYDYFMKKQDMGQEQE
ncbi:MAG: 16S rRNA (cytidine(1402)-2'-O)-methyltransferase [Eubacteriaceae bacterium]|nr:16S rRNA (cytidine(1402)-2'-O)-methyltransferase [Eubacteriaceae bacterium]